MNKIYFSLFVALICLLSCNDSNKTLDCYSLVKTNKNIKIPIDNQTKLFTFSLHHFEDTTGIEYITLENNKFNADYGIINFYRLDSCKLSHQVKVYKSGPNAIVGMEGHGVLSLDEIIVSSGHVRSLYKINREGELLHEYNYSTNTQGGINTVSMFNSIFYTPLIFINGKIYGWQMLPMSRFQSEDGNNFEFDESPISIAIDTASGEYYTPKLCYPKLYDKDNKVGHNEFFSRIYDGKNFVYSFCVLDSIYVSDDLKQMKSYYAKSKYIDKVENGGYDQSMDAMQSLTYSNNLARYGNIIFDKYNNVYYRFCHFADNQKDIQNEYLLCHGEFSIQIINSDFKVIGETKFPRGKYAPMLFFVNKEGLWLSENNYERMGKDMNDDLLVFSCFTLNGK